MKRKYIILLVVAIFLLIAYLATRSFLDTSQNVNSWTFYTLDGTPVSVEDYKGKNIVLNLWATWCKPCLKELPILDKARQKLGDDFVFLAASDDNPDKVRIFSETNDYGFEYLTSVKFSLKGVVFIPQTFVLDQSGKLRKHQMGTIKYGADKLVDSLKIWTGQR